MKPSLQTSQHHCFPLSWSGSSAMQGGTIGNSAMKNIHTYQCKLVQAMAFMSIGGILKSIKSQGQILWKLSSFHRVWALSLPTESVVSSPESLGFGCLCGGQCWHGMAVPGPVLCWSRPCLPDLASQLDLRPASSLRICLVITELLANAGYHHRTCSVCLTGVPWDCVASQWGCCPACLTVTLSSWLPVPCRAASSQYSLMHKVNFTQFCCLVFIILYSK